MTANTKNLLQAGDLLWAWTGRNIRARYQQSALGWFWAIIQPVAQVAIFSIVFTLVVPVDTGDVPYVIFSYVAVLPWTLMAMSLPDMSNSLVDNMNLVTKIYFPREVLPFAAMLARLMDFGVASVLIGFLLVFFRISVDPAGLLFLPLILMIQLLLISGIGLACAALNVYFRDVRSLLVLGLQVWFYASPIIYPSSMVPEQWHTLYYLNPMAGIISAYRAVLLYGQVPDYYLGVAGLMSVVIFVGGYWFFKRVEFQFADVV